MKINRKKKREISIGNVQIGGDFPVVVQSMTNTDTRDIVATVNQIKRLQDAGCEVVRVSVLDKDACRSISEIRSQIAIPLVADIHFDYKLALEAIKNGSDAIRINPGNIGSKKKIREVVAALKENCLPIRIGVNAGSLEKDLLDKYGHPVPDAMVESALRHVAILEDLNFYDMKISLKASNVRDTVDAYRIISQKVDYPLHIGISEAGTSFCGIIRSSIGIGILLSEGIGDTIRVSLTADPAEEVRAGFEILKALGIRERGINIISCPTCGRSEIDVIDLVSKAEERLSFIKEPLNISVMGCVVNGIGEGREADIGIAGGRGSGILFKNGKVIKKVREEEIIDMLVKEIDILIKEKGYV
ncbi:MAG: flavodoxin-dependent (E)-4-hydroxy-3-methylbut-2-enyl-diphosphate synthase [Nitrospirota bacterium]